MSKRILFAFILINYFCNILFSQNFGQYFGLLQSDQPKYYSEIVNSNNQNTYAVLNCVSNSLNKFNYAQVLFFDKSQNLIDSVKFQNTFFPYNKPIRKNNKLYWAAVYTDTLFTPVRKQLAIMELDTNYTHLSTYKISEPLSFDILNAKVVEQNGVFYTFYSQASISQSQFSKIYALNSQLQKTDSTLLHGGITELSLFQNKLIITGFSLPTCANSSIHAEKLVLDSSLNIINCKEIDSVYSNYSYGKLGLLKNYSKTIPLSKTKSILIGNSLNTAVNMSYTLQYMINSIIDNNNHVLKTNVIANAGLNAGYVSNLNNVDYNGKEILTLGCFSCDFNIPFLNQNQLTNMYVNKLDTMGNIIWAKEYGIDMFYYPKSIGFTTDGGCLISGLRYNILEAPIPNIMESFLLKLNANGEVETVGIIENGKLLKNIARCFPNPATNQIRFDLPFSEGYNLKISDLNGADILESKNTLNSTSIDISKLKSGVYFYQISDKKSVYYGKFIHL